MEKYICIHGHFYQPPRENPWLESVELQDSAWPYHDWNECITAECYAPNATARIMNGEGRIDRIVSNYARISFNFGPTVLAWLKDKMPEIHNAIIAADKQSQQNYSGHGSAMAQVYNHMILPLGNNRDKWTQVRWGLRDFEHRFGRSPEGMWLAETAADTETLDVLARQGIKFTILSPFQASRVREIGKKYWRDVDGGRIDPTRPYLMRLPEGRSITLFFYDAPVSQAVAFEKLLESGEKFAGRLTSAFSDKRNWDQLVHIATDGESYGHHHRHGEMALAYTLHFIESTQAARLTNYGEYLARHTHTHEVQIHEKSAWSCSHGVSRWIADCGCNSGGHAGWNQMWRGPLRDALDWLRDEVAPRFEEKARHFLKDPWEARNEYISVILDRSPESINTFLSQQGTRELGDFERVSVLKLMELQRHAMLMYTSCGWFFDELSGLETVQVIQYAARVLQLANQVFEHDFEPAFVERLRQAKSNIAENCDGEGIYRKFVKPAMIDWEKAVAHYAVSSVFENYPERAKVFVYRFEDEDRSRFEAGRPKLIVGRTRASFDITQESALLSYAVLYMGEHNVTGGVQRYTGQETYDAMVRDLKEAFDRADFPELIRRIDRHFGGSNYSLKSLFKDQQRSVLNEILASTREDLDGRFRLISERYTPLMRFLKDLGAPLPSALQAAVDFILHSDVQRQFRGSELPDPERLRSLIEEARTRNVQVLDADLSYSIKNKLETIILQLATRPDDLAILRNLEEVTAIVMPLPLGLNLWKVQNTYY
jgi:alpha-amylase/alpha-mannosidase (GH57 family)